MRSSGFRTWSLRSSSWVSAWSRTGPRVEQGLRVFSVLPQQSLTTPLSSLPALEESQLTAGPWLGFSLPQSTPAQIPPRPTEGHCGYCCLLSSWRSISLSSLPFQPQRFHIERLIWAVLRGEWHRQSKRLRVRDCLVCCQKWPTLCRGSWSQSWRSLWWRFCRCS